MHPFWKLYGKKQLCDDDNSALDGTCSSTIASDSAEEIQGLVHAAVYSFRNSLMQQLTISRIAFQLADIEHNDVLD